MEKHTRLLIARCTLIPTILFLLGTGCSGTRPSFVNTGTLAPCPETPNCVFTRATDSVHAIAPLSYRGSAAESMERLVSVIDSLDRTSVVTRRPGYLYVEFTSGFWRFVDDVEFQFVDSTRTIHFRSASRLGKSDFNVNRNRMETIRKRYGSPDD